MKFVLLSFACLSIWAVSSLQVRPVQEANTKVGPRVIGGANARAGQFPFAVAFYYTTALGRFFCGGALISNQWILTAGRCVANAIQFTVYIGSHTLSSTDTNRLIVVANSSFLHPNYNNLTLENNIGLIHLPTPVLFSDYISSMFLPTADLQHDAEVYVIGWGQTDDYTPGPVNHLNFVLATTLSEEACAATYGTQISTNSVCVGGSFNQGTCLGDSGTPLVRYILNERHAEVVGISSFVSQKGCESTDPSGYAKTFGATQWIRNLTGIV